MITQYFNAKDGMQYVTEYDANQHGGCVSVLIKVPERVVPYEEWRNGQVEAVESAPSISLEPVSAPQAPVSTTEKTVSAEEAVEELRAEAKRLRIQGAHKMKPENLVIRIAQKKAEMGLDENDQPIKKEETTTES